MTSKGFIEKGEADPLPILSSEAEEIRETIQFNFEQLLELSEISNLSQHIKKDRCIYCLEMLGTEEFSLDPILNVEFTGKHYKEGKMYGHFSLTFDKVCCEERELALISAMKYRQFYYQENSKGILSGGKPKFRVNARIEPSDDERRKQVSLITHYIRRFMDDYHCKGCSCGKDSSQ